MAYLVPAEFVTKMVDAGESKVFMSTRDTVIRAFMAGAILGLAAAFAIMVTAFGREKLINDSAVSLTVGATPSVGLDAIAVGYAAGGATTSLGILPFFQKDVLYDFAAGTIGVADKK